MLTDVCHHLHNYFETDRYEGVFTIQGGAITLSFLVVGQRFRILGSAANDGIYTYHATGVIWDDDNKAAVSLIDETFKGVIISMGVPREALQLVEEINAWKTKYADSLSSPFQQESFGGYSYTKATGGHGTGEMGSPINWQDMFRGRLNAYRKIA